MSVIPGFKESPAKKPNTSRLMRKSTPSSAVNAMAIDLKLIVGRFSGSALLLIEFPACVDDASNGVFVAGRGAHEHRVRLHPEHGVLGGSRGIVAIGKPY